MKKKYVVTTKVGEKSFESTFYSPVYVDKYLKGANEIWKKKFPQEKKAVIYVNGTKVTKKY